MLELAVPSQKPRITIYLPQKVKEKFEALAEQNERSASAYALYLIERAIWEAEQKGELPADES
ncbi:MAG: ribbon-helix-helix protein, CopG family [Cyanobacteria bacterium]|nr:ribbon-helix-helix protein, CopG family [Cyanobacteriota bacterium]MDA0867478.1 ribbon-helix-helix protein, CopG family [Cyanobacteriota bacterium]